MHARGSGPRVMMTRQPTEGKSKNGGMCLFLLYRNSPDLTIVLLSSVFLMVLQVCEWEKWNEIVLLLTGLAC